MLSVTLRRVPQAGGGSVNVTRRELEALRMLRNRELVARGYSPESVTAACQTVDEWNGQLRNAEQIRKEVLDTTNIWEALEVLTNHLGAEAGRHLETLHIQGIHG